MRAAAVFVLTLVVARGVLSANDKPLTPQEQQELDAHQKADDARREAAIAEFTRKMKEANYPALFEAAAREFKVPADVLKGVAFTETRWEHLTWPPGETESPESGMPRPYGIMSLWDNKYFGHSLLEAAALIGKDAEELKRDANQNIRGGAALLRKIYDQTPRPDNSSEAAIESWRYAIRVYCGIPEPDLNAQHAFDVYAFMNEGYHQYGIEWNARPVNLEPLREETRAIVAAERKKREDAQTAGSNAVANSIGNGTIKTSSLATPPSNSVSLSTTALPSFSPALGQSYPASLGGNWLHWMLWAGVFLIAAIALILYLLRTKPPK